MTKDLYDLQRFVDAQSTVYARVERELSAGRKTSHWMWFVFPQLAGLGASAMAQRYAIGSLAEAGAYLRHPLLGLRLRSATSLVLAVENASAAKIFGHPDDRKFHSSMTLFALAAAASAGGPEPLFAAALERYFGEVRDAATLALLS